MVSSASVTSRTLDIGAVSTSDVGAVVPPFVVVMATDWAVTPLEGRVPSGVAVAVVELAVAVG